MSHSIQCINCLLFNSDNDDAFTCDAFPAAIPQEILLGEHDHLNPFPGDRGFLRVPIRWTGDGRFIVVTPADEAKEIVEPIDLSARRDAEVGELYGKYIELGDSRAYVPEARPDSSDFNDWDYYNTYYSGRKIIITRELTKRINLAAAVLKSPDYVFRDFQFQKTTGQKYVVENWIGRVVDADRLIYIKVRVVNDTVHRLAIARVPGELPGVLSDISGISVLKTI